MAVNQVLRYFILTGVFLVPFVPLIVANSQFFPFITGKNFAFRILVELMLGGWVVLMLRDVRYRPQFSWILAGFGALLVTMAISTVLSENPFKSFWSNFERMEGYITLLHLFGYFVVVSSVLNTEKLWNRFFNTSIGVSMVMALYGFLQLAGVFVINQGGVRLDARLGNATYLAIYMVFHLFLTAFLLLRWRGHVAVKWLYGGIIFIQAIILYYTASRGAIIGLTGGIILAALLIAFFERERKTLRRAALGVLLGVLILVGGFFAIKNTDVVNKSEPLRRLATISLADGSTRFIIWSMAWQGVKERPLFGWGQESFNFVFNKYYDPRLYSQEPWFDRVHHIIFDWLVAGGFLGRIAYLSLYVAALRYLWSRRPSFLSVIDKSILTGLLAASFFQYFFVFDNIVSYFLFFSVLAYISQQFARPPAEGSFLSRELDPGVVLRVVAPLMIVVIAFTLYFFNAKGILASRALLQALSSQEGGAPENLKFFREALAYNTVGKQEVREQLAQVTSRLPSLGADISIQQEFFNLTQEELLAQVKETPTDARSQLFVGALLDQFGQREEASVFLKEALKLSPRKQGMFFQLGSNTINRGDKEGAVELFRQAFELDQTYPAARLTYAMGLLYSGEVARADELLTEGFGTVIIDDDQLVRAYVDVGLLDRVVEVWEKRVEREPGNAQYHLSLAAAYLQSGQRESAIVELERVIELNPDFKEQGEFYIREIRAGRNP